MCLVQCKRMPIKWNEIDTIIHVLVKIIFTNNPSIFFQIFNVILMFSIVQSLFEVVMVIVKYLLCCTIITKL